MSYKDADTGLTARANLSLTGADASVLLASGARPPVTGSLDLSAEVEGTGLSPVGLIGSLQGKGKIAIAGAQFAGLDPRAFDTVTRAVDQGLTIDTAGIAKVVQRALESGQLSVKRADGAFLIGAGQVRLSNLTVDSKDAELSLTGNIDLTEGSLDARMVLSGANEAAGGRPDIFMGLTGPLAAPNRNIDVSALTGWLTLRAVEHQAKRLREAEAQRQREIEAEKRRREIEAQRRRKIEAERQRRALEAERRQQEIEAAQQRQVLEALQRRQALEAARSQPVPPPAAPKNKAAPGPLSVTPPVLSRPQAPVLPAPVDIKPLPAPAGAGQPAGSVGSQN